MARGLLINVQKIQIAANAGLATAIAAKHADPFQAWVLPRHPFRPVGHLGMEPVGGAVHRAIVAGGLDGFCSST